MTVNLVVVKFPHVSGLPRDTVVNTFVFQASNQANVDAVVDGVFPELYNNAFGGHSIAEYLGNRLSRSSNAASYTQYDITSALDGSPHGGPVRTTHFTLGNATSGTYELPEELSLVVSYHSDYGILSETVGSTRPKQRHRGRVYIGPLNNSAHPSSTGNESRPDSTFVTTLYNAFNTQLLAGASPNWVGWSRQNAAVYTVVGGFIDDAWDIQRRRGVAAAGRTAFGT